MHPVQPGLEDSLSARAGDSQLELATVECISWFNNDRLHEFLADIPPVEFEGLFASRGHATMDDWTTPRRG